MFRKFTVAGLCILVLNLLFSSSVFAETKSEREAKRIQKVRTNVEKLGTGKSARIELKLKDGTKLKGYIDRINENNFVVIDEKTGAENEVPYPQVKQVKGNNLSTGVKIAIGVGIAIVVLVVIALIGRSEF